MVQIRKRKGLSCQEAPEHRRRKMAKLPTIALKAVVPIIQRGEKERAMLKKDLCRMDCHSLMERSWCLEYEKIVAKFLTI